MRRYHTRPAKSHEVNGLARHVQGMALAYPQQHVEILHQQGPNGVFWHGVPGQSNEQADWGDDYLMGNPGSP